MLCSIPSVRFAIPLIALALLGTWSPAEARIRYKGRANPHLGVKQQIKVRQGAGARSWKSRIRAPFQGFKANRPKAEVKGASAKTVAGKVKPSGRGAPNSKERASLATQNRDHQLDQRLYASKMKMGRGIIMIGALVSTLQQVFPFLSEQTSGFLWTAGIPIIAYGVVHGVLTVREYRRNTRRTEDLHQRTKKQFEARLNEVDQSFRDKL